MNHRKNRSSSWCIGWGWMDNSAAETMRTQQAYRPTEPSRRASATAVETSFWYNRLLTFGLHSSCTAQREHRSKVHAVPPPPRVLPQGPTHSSRGENESRGKRPLSYVSRRKCGRISLTVEMRGTAFSHGGGYGSPAGEEPHKKVQVDVRVVQLISWCSCCVEALQFSCGESGGIPVTVLCRPRGTDLC